MNRSLVFAGGWLAGVASTVAAAAAIYLFACHHIGGR